MKYDPPFGALYHYLFIKNLFLQELKNIRIMFHEMNPDQGICNGPFNPHNTPFQRNRFIICVIDLQSDIIL